MSTTQPTVTFPRGGVHPSDDKLRTQAMPIQVSEPPASVTVLMVQHIGAPAAPVVKRKDAVKKGQLIGEAQGFISANVHSPVSGTVKAVETAIFPVTGASVQAVVIENDGEEAWADGCNVETDPESLDPRAMVERVQECGIVGMGGATFPAHVKLSPPDSMPITDLLINAAECEPSVTIDHRIMLEKADDLVDALRLTMRMVGAKNGYIGIETNKPDAIEAMSKASEDEPDIRVYPLKTKYPQGSEQQLITAITGREVPSGGGLPGHVGCVVHNVATMLAIRDAVRLNRPLIERGMTVSGDGIVEAGNFVERIGASVGDILRRQGMRPEANQLIMGGPMMGIAQATIEVPVIKGTSCLLVRHAVPKPEMRDCIRCGRCVAQCPLGLMPGEMSIACEREDWDRAIEMGMMECKECGCCAYVCPAQRHIVHLVKFGKSELRRKRSK